VTGSHPEQRDRPETAAVTETAAARADLLDELVLGAVRMALVVRPAADPERLLDVITILVEEFRHSPHYDERDLLEHAFATLAHRQQQGAT